MQQRVITIQSSDWQAEAWRFFHSLGELHFAYNDWLGNCLSRVRMFPAIPQENSYVEITDGPAADLMSELFHGDMAGMLAKLTIHLSVPGESYLVGEETNTGRQWTVCSSDELRIRSRTMINGNNVFKYERMIAYGEWVPVADESMVSRIWNPDPQYSWRATSAMEAALSVVRELDLYNRYIIAILISRLASNGMLLIPSEVEIPSRSEFKDADDPFIAELIEVAKQAIKDPGSASAAIPIPIRVPADYVDKFRHLTMDSPISEFFLDLRKSALERLATALTMPAEILTGVAQMNHWGQWQLEESAIKTFVSPVAEMLANSLTRGYLLPLLQASGIDVTYDGQPIVIWYDTSALALAPDKTSMGQSLYDRGELAGDTLRKVAGFGESDRPTLEEFTEIALKRIAMGAGASSLIALAQLTGNSELADLAQGISTMGGEQPSKSPDVAPIPQPGGQPVNVSPGTRKGAPEKSITIPAQKHDS
jgi:hypothetical protein